MLRCSEFLSRVTGNTVERTGGFIAEREKEREREKDSAGRLRDDIVREGFFRRVFPGCLFFSLSRVRRDKPPPDVRGGEGVGVDEEEMGTSKTGN